jgi:hypothetical protein
MLMTLFSIVADMAENPEGFRTDVRKALLDLTDDYNLPGIPDDAAKEARDIAKQIINGILQSETRQTTLIGRGVPYREELSNRQIRRKFYVVLQRPKSTSGQRTLHKSAPGQEQRQVQSTARSTLPRLSRRTNGRDRRGRLHQ